MPNTNEIKEAFIALLDRDVKQLPNSAINRLTTTVLYFNYMPESISESKSAQYEGITILGRTEPVRLYSSSGVRSLTLPLQFMAEQSFQDDVMTKIDFCRALVYPNYQFKYPYPPMRVKLHIGNLIDMAAIITNCNVSYIGPWDTGTDGAGTNYYPFRADIQLTFEEVLQKQVDFIDIMSTPRP